MRNDKDVQEHDLNFGITRIVQFWYRIYVPELLPELHNLERFW